MISNPFRVICLTCLLTGGLLSCSKKDQPAASSAADIQQFSLVPGKDKTVLDPETHQISVVLPVTVDSGTDLTAYFSLSPGATASLDGIVQQSGITKNDFERDVRYTVTAADQHTSQSWTIKASNNDFSISWGLGHFLRRTVNEDRLYDWYIDQSTSGTYAAVNCGPASVTMAIKWADSTFSKTAENARQTYEPAGGWWFTSDIHAYLTDNQIDHAIIGLTQNPEANRDILIHQLNKNQIIILCLDMDYVRSADDASLRVDKFYPTTPKWGHFIVLKGYKIVDQEVFFEAYDPFSFNLKNEDNTFKGMNRYYRYEDLSAAVQLWWDFAFVIAKKGEQLDVDAVKRKLNPANIPVGYSRSAPL